MFVLISGPVCINAFSIVKAHISRPVTRIIFGGWGGGRGGGVLTKPKWTKLSKCIFYFVIRIFSKVAIHEKL